MKTKYTMLLFLALSPSLQAQLTVQTDPYDFEILVRVDDSGQRTLDATLDPGAMDTLDLGNGYRLGIVTPAAAPKGTESVDFTLSVNTDDDWLPLHTYRQPMRDKHFLKLGYRVCEQQVTLFNPVGDTLPGC